MSFLASALDSLFPACREGTLSCPCGAVQCELRVPFSSYGLIDQTNALCQCNDCLAFCQACPNGQAVIHNHATHMVNFYKSDVTITKGHDQIRAVKLRDDTPLIRLYCAACGTPLGAQVVHAPVVLLYHDLLTQGPIYLPTLVLGRKWAPPAARPYATAVHRYYNFGFFFLLKVVGRVLLGFLWGNKDGPGLLEASAYDTVPVGLGSIG